jgi:hypothetical protein
MLARIAALVFLALAACAQLRADRTVCPEFRRLRCVTGTICSFDRSRGCRVCRCDVPFGAATADNPAPPPKRIVE